MVINGYAKDYMYTGDGTLMIKVRIPAIHGAYNQSEYKGGVIRNYVLDSDLPYYPSVLLPHLPSEGEVVMLMATEEKAYNFVVVGLTGGSYYTGTQI